MIRLDSDIESAVLASARRRALIEGRGPSVQEFLLNPYRFGAGATDPNYSLRVLGLHCDGVNGGTSFSDNSPAANTVTPTSCTTSTTQSKFGGTSAFYANGASSPKLTINHTTALTPAGDFTAACFFYVPTVTGSTRHLITKSLSSGHTPYTMRVTTAGKLQCYASDSGGTSLVVNITTSASVVTGWNHGAFTRSGSTYRAFLNGTLDGTGTNAGTGYSNATHPLVIGNTSDNAFALGANGDAFIDEVLVYNGVALWTASFTPPTSPFPNS